MSKPNEFVVTWEIKGERPVSACVRGAGGQPISAPVPEWPPKGGTAGTPDSLVGLVENARHVPEYFQARLHAELQRRGRGLWDALFPGKVGEAILAEAGGLGSRRLVLETEDESLLSLPLEAAVPPDGTTGIGCDARFEVVRRLSGPEPSPEIPAGPLRIVVAVESPDEDKAASPVLNYEAEEWILLEALDRPIADQKAFVEFLDEGHLSSMLEAVADLRPQVLHVSGHGLPGGLAFEGPDGEEVLVSAGQLAAALRAFAGIRLLVVSACMSGVDPAAGGRTIGPGVARALVQAGFPAVLAMQASVTDDFAARMLGEFYQRLGQGAAPAQALAEARREVSRPQPGLEPTGEWAAPVLYEGPQPVALLDRGASWLPRPHRVWPGWEGVSFKPRGEFVGRRRYRREALRALRSHDGVGLVWHGLGGVGKSAFSTHVAERLMQADGYRVLVFTREQTPAKLLDEMNGRLRFWALDEHDDPAKADHLRQLARGLTPEGGLDEPGRWQWLKKILAQEPILLVFDNFEDNLTGPFTPAEGLDARPRAPAVPRCALKNAELDARLRDLLSPRGRARFLFTTRYPFGLGPDLRLHGLVETHLAPLSEPETRKMMFRLPRLRALNTKEKTDAYHTVGGHPRCLEYLDALLRGDRQWPAEAPRLRADLARKIPRADLDPSKWTDALAETVAQAAEDILLDRLLEPLEGTPARALLDRIAVFRQRVGRFALELAVERDVADVELDTLDALTLLWREDDQYMVPQVTATALLDRQEPDAIRAAHARAALYWQHRAQNYGGDLADWLETRHHCLEAGQHDKAHAIAFAAEDFLDVGGLVREAEALARETYDLAKAAGLTETQAEAANRLGLLARGRGDVPEAIRRHQESGELCRAIGDRLGEGNALGNLGLAYAALGDARRAIGYYEQQLGIVREIGDRRGEGNALGSLGNAYLSLGDARRAIAYYEQCLKLHREIGDRRGEGNALGSLGNAHLTLGDAPRAIAHYEQALVIDREIGDRRGEGNALGNLGSAYADLGDARRAIAYYEQQLVIVREIGDRRGEGNALGNLGSAYADLGDARRAVAYYEQRLVIAREIGDRQGECAALGNLGDEWRKLGEHAKARACLEDGLRLALEALDPLRTVQIAWQLADIESVEDHAANAVALEAYALSRFHAMGYPQAEAAAQDLARYQKQMGEEKFQMALAQAEQTVAAIFRRLGGDPAAEMAHGFLAALSDPDSP